MNQTSVLLFVAGATMSMGSALAQNAKFEAAKAETLADAATRTSYLAGGAGFNNGAFNINDGTGNNSLNIGGTIATRYNLNFRSEDSVGDQDDMTIGFNMPFNRVRFWGNVGSKDIDYMIQFTSSDTSGGTSFDTGEGTVDLPSGNGVEDAWGRYNFEGGASVTWGQFKLPLIRQVMVDNEYQLAMDRSVTSAVFTQGYSQGAMFTYAGEQFKISVAFSDGLNTAGTDFNSGSEADFGITGRVDFMAMGNNWNRFNDETSWKSNTDNALLIGGALHYQTGGETGGTQDVDVFAYTVDASFEAAGWNITGAFMGNNIDPAGGESISNYGLFVQGGIFLSDQFEIFARGDGIFLDDALAAQDDNIWFITLGVNHYLFPESHAVKFTFQINYSLNDNTPLFGTDGLVSDPSRYGYLGDSEDGEWGVGAQGIVRW